MLIAISGDWHLHSYQGPMVRTLADGTNSRLKDILDCAAWMTDVAVERGAAAFLHTGDLMHNRKAMANEAWTRVSQHMRRMNERIPTYVLEGNHDQSASGDGTSTVGALDGLVHAVTSAQVIKIGGLRVGWLPYTDDAEAVRLGTAALADKGAEVLVAHLGIGDPRFSNCVPIDYETPGHIGVADLSPDLFRQVFLGHYHTAQDLGPNVRYAGSPLQLSFKEAGIAKGFWLWDTKTDAVEFVENTASPRFHKLTDAAAIAQFAHGEIPKTDFVWVDGADRDTAQAVAAHAAETGMVVRIDRAPARRDIAVRVDPTSPLLSQLDQYTRHVVPDEGAEERAALVALGADLMTKTGE